MPRKTRIDGPGVVHHIIVRGMERRSIFKDDHDRERFTMDATAAMHHAIVRGIERRYRVRFVEFSCLNLLPISC
jgi:REP element-mobilizing transposase RayT